MSQSRSLHVPFAASAVLALSVLLPRIALAQSTCSSNADCGQGFECTVVGGTGCASSGAAPACPPGGDCPLADRGPQPECTPTYIMACTPAHCTSDAQCAAGMVCHAWTSGCASTDFAAPDCACPSDAPDCGCGGTVPACTPTTESFCTPRYMLPCSQAADCGQGFSCEQQQSCGCAGGGSAGSPAPNPSDPAEPGAGAPLPPDTGTAGSSGMSPPADPLPEPDCTCEPSGIFACIPQEIACESTSDCPGGWLCQEQPQVARPGCAGDGCPEADPLPPARKLCQPEYYGGVAVDQGGVAIPGTPTSAGNPKGGTGTGNNTGSPEGAGESGADEHESSACQMGHAPASTGALSLLAVLGAALGLKRRRARA
jgi:hypothetical protein